VTGEEIASLLQKAYGVPKSMIAEAAQLSK
jgi:hypothetical protein